MGFRARSMGLVAILISIAGCIEEEVHIVLRKDGSGYATHVLKIALRAQGGDHWNRIKGGRASIEKSLEGSGVKLEAYKESSEPFGDREVRFELSFTKIEDYVRLDPIHYADLALKKAGKGHLAFDVMLGPRNQSTGLEDEPEFDAVDFVNAYEGGRFTLHVELPNTVVSADGRISGEKRKTFTFGIECRTPEDRRSTAWRLGGKWSYRALCSMDGIEFPLPVLPKFEGPKGDPSPKLGEGIVLKGFDTELRYLQVIRRRVHPDRLKGRYQSHSGPWGGTEVYSRVICPEGMNPFEPFEGVIEKAVDNTGKDLACKSPKGRPAVPLQGEPSIDGHHIWSHVFYDGRSSLPFSVDLLLPSRKATKISALEGTVTFRVSGRERAILLKEGNWEVGKIPDDPDLRELGFFVESASLTEFKVRCRDFYRVVNITPVDEDGRSLISGHSNTGSSHCSTRGTYRFESLLGPYGLEVVIRKDVKTVKVPFSFKDIELP